MKRGIYPGSFDPVTYGHIDIIKRASRMLDELIVAVVVNPSKKPLFSLKERLLMLKKTLSGFSGVKMLSFKGLLVDFAKQQQSALIVKGLRAVSDFEFEYQMALMNNKLNPSIDTIFMMTSSQYAFLSSSSVREIASLGGDIKGLVSPYVEMKLKEKYKKLSGRQKSQDVAADM